MSLPLVERDQRGERHSAPSADLSRPSLVLIMGLAWMHSGSRNQTLELLQELFQAALAMHSTDCMHTPLSTTVGLHISWRVRALCYWGNTL